MLSLGIEPSSLLEQLQKHVKAEDRVRWVCAGWVADPLPKAVSGNIRHAELDGNV